MGASDRVPSSEIGARHLRQWITVTRPATRSFHNRAGMLNFASHAVHATGNDIGLMESAAGASSPCNGPRARGFSTRNHEDFWRSLRTCQERLPQCALGCP